MLAYYSDIPAGKAERCCQFKSRLEPAPAASVFPESGGFVKRTYVYVDGFNLYYRALRKTKFKWLNLEALAK
jgi:hypothetical protein